MATEPQHHEEAGTYIRRASGFIFFLLCVLAGLFTGILLFLVLGLIATALDLSPGVLALIALGGFVVGFVAPIVLLRRRRRSPKARRQAHIPDVGALYDWVAPLQVQGIVEKTWYFEWVVNVVVALLDDRALKAAGWGSEKLNSWLVILIPVYLYKRDQMLRAGMTRFWVWIGSFIVSLLPIW